MEGFVHPDFAQVTEKVQQLMSKKSARGGMAVAVYHHGELVVDAWTGQRNAAGDPWTRDTMSMSFSTTKGVVATIVHRLVDRGLLDYDAPVATYWPEFATAGKGSITLRQLLDHPGRTPRRASPGRLHRGAPRLEQHGQAARRGRTGLGGRYPFGVPRTDLRLPRR